MPIRKLGKIFVITGLLIASSGFILVFYHQIRSKHTVTQMFRSTQRSIQPSPEYDYTSSQYGQAIQQGQIYLVTDFREITPNLRLIVDYLQRKYGLSKQLSAGASPITPPTKGQQEDPLQFTAFKRIAYPNAMVSVLPPADGDTMTQMMMQAVNCDHIPLSPKFADLVRTNIEAGGYKLTHVAFSLQRMKENGCNYFSSDQTKLLEQEVADRIVGLVTKPDITPDLRYEAIAFVLDQGRPDLVPEAWISKIVSEQQSDGGWKAHPEDSKTDHHASILALWILLEKSRPNPPTEPMIHRPNS